MARRNMINQAVDTQLTLFTGVSSLLVSIIRCHVLKIKVMHNITGLILKTVRLKGCFPGTNVTDGHADTVFLCCCLLGERSFMEECKAGLSQALSICSISQRQFGQLLRKPDDSLFVSDCFKASAESERKKSK